MSTKKSMINKLLMSSAVATVTVSIPYHIIEAAALTPEVEDEIQTLRYGHVSSSVSSLQETLKQLGYYSNVIDGIFGTGTQIALRKYQFRHGLLVDGILGPETLRSLSTSTLIRNNDAEKYVEQYRENSIPKLPMNLTIGTRGDEVTVAQKILAELDYYSYTIDGIFGSRTNLAVSHFQKNNNLTVTGVIDQETWKKLHATDTIANEAIPVQVAKDSVMIDGTFIQSAMNLIGTPYKWGGTTPSGFDCSGFIKYVFAKKGIQTPRTVNEIWNYGIHIQKPSIGDLVFFETYKPGPSHAGIYIGDGRFVHAGSSTGVTISKLDQSYWSQRYLGTKRIVQYQ